jgi:hypothetical protein
MSNETKPVLSLADFNASAKCSNAFEFPYLDEAGEETAWRIQVIGDQAPQVKRAIYSKINAKRAQEDFLKKKGKTAPLEDIEDLIADNLEGLAACVVGWSGIVEPYSAELAKQALENNKSLAEQVKSASENILNFTVSK